MKTALDALQEIQAYVDERARRHAVTGERATEAINKIGPSHQRLEALEIGQFVARKISELKNG